ncbi:MAG: peptidoglycan DD-metalloendopeptidase family protein [Alphaproteobacteria bacterium]
MVGDATSDSSAGRLFMRRVKHAFREREIIIRSEGRVRYLRLTTVMQVSVVCLIAANVVWGIGAAASSWTMNRVVEARNDEIVEAKLAYETLRQGLIGYQKAIDGAVASLGGDRTEDPAFVLPGKIDGAPKELTDIAHLNATLLQSIEGIQDDLDMPLEEREQAIASRRMLQERIVALQEALEASRIRETKLGLETQELTARVEAILSDRQRVIGERENLEARTGDLAVDLELQKQLVAELSTEIENLTNRFEDARQYGHDVAAQNEDLQLTIAVLRGTLATERSERSAIEARIGDVADALASRLPGHAAMERIAQSGSVLISLESITGDITSSLDDARYRTESMVSVVDDVLEGLTKVAGGTVDESTDELHKVAQARLLLADIENLHMTQQKTVETLLADTDASISEAENLLQMTNLEKTTLAQLAGLPMEARGGPMTTEDIFNGTSSGLQADVANLEEKVERLVALREVMACIPWISPVDFYNITSKFGKRRDPISGKMALHKGLDMAGWPKTPIYAPAPGEVTYAGWHGRYGRMVEIDHGCGIKTRFAHMRSISVEVGETLPHRTKIGTIGSTGRSTGPHVHYEILIADKPVDPAPFIEAGRHVFKG